MFHEVPPARDGAARGVFTQKKSLRAGYWALLRFM
jgi:hypothetical protein